MMRTCNNWLWDQLTTTWSNATVLIQWATSIVAVDHSQIRTMASLKVDPFNLPMLTTTYRAVPPGRHLRSTNLCTYNNLLQSTLFHYNCISYISYMFFVMNERASSYHSHLGKVLFLFYFSFLFIHFVLSFMCICTFWNVYFI